MERVVFDRVAELDQLHWWFLARRRILEALVKRVVRPSVDAKVLEVGCGTGHNFAMLGRFGKVDACEPDKCARALATKRLGRQVRNAKLPDLTMFKRNGYDLIALLDVLQQVPDDLAALRAIHMRLKPGGALLLTVPANAWMWSAHDSAGRHYRRYSKKQLQQLFLKSGLEVKLLSYFNTMLFPPIALARVIGKVTRREPAHGRLPAAPANWLLEKVFGIERWLLGRLPMPVGVSLVAVVRRPA